MFQKNKYIILVILLLSVALGFLYFTSNNKTYADELNKSIKEIIDEKQDNHNYMHDSYFISKLDELISILYKDNLENIEYVYGNLDDDRIPEIIVFNKRNPKDPSDEGSLTVYKYISDRYTLIDNISMNYDNDNYDLIIGKVSEDQNGLYVNNQVGAHSGMTYGFILENNRLKSILNPNKLNLISVYTENEIKDINNNGILNFSIYTIDPESEDKTLSNSDKIMLWYEWDKNDSANLVAIEKDGVFESDTNNIYLFTEGYNHLDTDYSKFLSFLDENVNDLNRKQISKLLDSYIQVLENNISLTNSILEEKLHRNDVELEKDLSLNLNSIEEINNSLILENKNDLKDFLISNLKLGYKLNNSMEGFKYDVDYDKFNKIYKEYISSEFKDFLDIYSIHPDTINDNMSEFVETIIERIVKIENYKNIYPYSKYIDNLNSIYSDNINLILFGDNSFSITNEDGKVKKDILNTLTLTKDKYPNTHLSSLLDNYIHLLVENDYNLNDTIKNSILDKIS